MTALRQTQNTKADVKLNNLYVILQQSKATQVLLLTASCKLDVT